MKNKERSKKMEIAKTILETYEPETAQDMQEALKDIFGPMFEAMLNGEMNSHLGYENNTKDAKSTNNRRNGYINKNVKTSFGELNIDVPRDRDSSFEPIIVPKREKDVSDIDKKVITMYGKGMSQRDIATTIEDIYGFKLSHESISQITDAVIEELTEWQSRPLKKMYTFVFVDCMYTVIRQDYEVKEVAVYTILGYDTDGHKDILGIWLNDSESKHTWMKIFDEIKQRGVEDILFISMDGVSGLEEGSKEIFKGVVVQRCIVHLIRNSLKYIPSKDFKKFTSNLKLIYGAPNLGIAKQEFDKFKNTWKQYPGAIDVWERNFAHVEQLYDFPSAVRKVMYTTNAIEAVNSSFRKVTKKGAFPNENALLKLLYLRIQELAKKWEDSTISNWAIVRNQLVSDPKFKERILKYMT